MIEVLVSLLVLSIGLLGLASLQTLGIRYAYNSYQGTQATLLAYDIIDLMRANKVALSAGEFSNVATTDMYTTATDCFASACSPQQLAQHDLRQWKTSIQLNLGPDATGAIGDVMDDRGWHLDRQQGGLHLMLWPYHEHVVEQFATDLADAVADHGESRGKAASYGGIS